MKKHILIVDDCEENVCLFKKILEDIDAEITSVYCGEDALQKIMSIDFDLMIVDVYMPGMSGIELLDRVRKDKGSFVVPAILISATCIEDKNVLEGLSVGAVDYITRPVNPEIFHEKVKLFLELFHYEKELRLEKKRNFQMAHNLRGIIESLPTGVIIVGLDKTILEINNSALQILGLDSVTGILGEHCDKLTCSIKNKGCPVLDYGNGNYQTEMDIVNTKGEKRWIYKTCVKGKYNGEDVLIETISDLSNIKNERRKRENVENKFSTLFESSDLAITYVGRNFKIKRVNFNAAKILNKSVVDLIGMDIKEVFGPIFSEQYLHKIESVLVSGRRLEIEGLLPVYQGKRWFQNVLSPVRSTNGDIDAVQIISYDINDKKIIEQHLAEAIINEKVAEEANELKSDFLANITHEFRTPLHGILSYAKYGMDVLKSDELNKEEVFEDFNEIFDSANRLLKLVNDILDLTKLEANKITYEKDDNYLIDTLGIVLSELKLLLKEKNIEIFVSDKSNRALANYDEFKMQQVFRNILSNAIRHSNKSSSIIIDIYEIEKDEVAFLAISIANHGQMIPKDKKKIIFDKFVQGGDLGMERGGTGLGLPICKKIIEDHFGCITVDSSIEKT